MSSTVPIAPAHVTYKKVTAKNAKCDICNTRNLGVMQKCVTCGVTTCEHCKAAGRYDSKHNLAGLNLDWTKLNPNRKGVRSSVRADKTVQLLVSSDDDDDGSLFVPEKPRAPRAPGTSHREGLIRERATITPTCNIRRARADQASQRQAALGDGPGSHATPQPQIPGHSVAYNPRPKPKPIVIGDDGDEDLMEISAPSSRDRHTSAVRDADANITQHLRDENEVLASEVRRLRDKERSHANENRRLCEQLQQLIHLAQEARVSYHREIASHKQTVNELADVRKDYGDFKRQLKKRSSDDAPSVPASATSCDPSADTTASSARAGAGRIRFSDLPAVKEARRNQLDERTSAKDNMATPLPTRISRNPFREKSRKRKHTTSSDTDLPDPSAGAPAAEDEDTPMEDASSDGTISLAGANATQETPVPAEGAASADTAKDAAPPATSQDISSSVESAGTQSRLSAACGVGVDDQVLFGVRRKWERSVSFHRVKVAEGPLVALQTLEATATLDCLSRGIPFPPQVDGYIQGVRKGLLLSARAAETGAAAAN